MHNCRQTKEQIREFVLDGADRPDDVLSAELRRCAACRAEFQALNATLRITTRLRESAPPVGNYWPGYHARLRQKLAKNVSDENRSAHKQSWFAAFVKSSVPVPVPVFGALLLICAVLVTLSMQTRAQQTVPAPSVVYVPAEVPVIKEKVVTRVVYRERRSSPKPLTGAAGVDGILARSQKLRSEDIPATLSGFKPTEEIKLTVIKGGSPNEK
jgi:hypothetical protein